MPQRKQKIVSSIPVREAVEVDRRHWIYRHSAVVRVTHWLSALAIAVLLMSGLQIFNAHPALYWGKQSDFQNPILEMKSEDKDDGSSKGLTTIFGRAFDTTGLLGVSRGADGEMAERGFPSWITLPGDQNLAKGRRWHFFFAWLLFLSGAAYLIHGLISRHLWRDLVPTGDDMRDIPHSIVEHARLNFPKGDEARAYNVLQKLSYLIVVAVIVPALVLAGMTMSPGLDTAFPQLLTLFGGRQSARTIHFLAAGALTLFILVHVAMVLVSGVWNNIRSMISGRFDITGKSKTYAQKRGA